MQGRVRVFAAALSIAVLPLGTMPPLAADAEGPASLEGKVIAGAGGPVAGAVVMVRSLDDAREHASGPTAEDGLYRLAGLPAGEYEVAVRTEKGIYLGARSLLVTAVTPQSYSFRIEDRPGFDPASLAEAGPEDAGAAGAKETHKQTKSKGQGQPGLGWSNPLVVLAAGLAFVIATGALIEAADDENDEDNDGSPGGP